MTTFRRFSHRWLLTAALAASLCLPANAGVPSQLSSADKRHAESAFYFAERDNWYEAVIHAARVGNPLMRDYMTWRALRDPDSDYDFSAFDMFLKRNPSWPDQKKLILRAESKLYDNEASIPVADRARWFKMYPPISGKGKLAYAETLAAQGAKPDNFTQLIRDAWRDGDFESSQEKEILQNYGNVLRKEDHIARIDRMIWEGKSTAAARTMFAVPEGHQKLFEARIRLQNNKPGAPAAVAQVPGSLKDDPGLLYERMKWRERDGQKDGVKELLRAAPEKVPYPEKWWSARHKMVRDALDRGATKEAMQLLKNHGQTEGIGKADALFLLGWLQFRQNDAGSAYNNFKDLVETVKFPVSLSRGYYWLGRAAQALGKKEEAVQHFGRAATYSTTFYGQLAAEKLQSNPTLKLPAVSSPTGAQRKAFEQDSRAKVIKMLSELGRMDETQTFFDKMLEDASNHADAVLAAELATSIGKQALGVKVAKEALKQHRVLLEAGYPHYKIDFKPEIEPSLMWAITRQESLFDPFATSKAGAKGLMQLMPGTARDTAKKMGVNYAASNLTDARYNLKLGSYFLGSLIDRFDGSYVLAIASYNAGPGNVRKWLDANGNPGNNPDKIVDWIESIPFSETRNYVQRVLENLQVYRAITDGKSTIHLMDDLKRGG